MKRYIKDGVIRTPKDIEIVKSIRNEIEVEDFVPIEGELDENGDQKFETVQKVVVQEKEVKVFNPSEEDILADGWKVYTPEPQAELGIKDLYTRDEYIRALIAEQYRLEDEIALINNYLSDASKYKEEYEEYQRFRAAAKSKASEIFG